MEDLLGLIFELLVETLFEIGISVIVAGVYRLLRRFWITARRGNAAFAALVLILIGASLGSLSVLVFPHPVVPASKLHGISLLVSPLITGLAMAAIGDGVRRSGRLPVRIESFSYGFAFAFTFSLIRILIVH
ncbi:MAG TPA: hypothetical protein VL135_12375 [Terracidiphilus sp.]|jgi:hypothetical protein|nr:hypothetical protein [Terracidiphilus sp.]